MAALTALDGRRNSRRSRRVALPRRVQPPRRRPARRAPAGCRILERSRRAQRGAATSPSAPLLRRRGARRPAAHALRLLRRGHPARVAPGARAEDAVRLQHRRDRAAPLHDRGERAQAPGARARPAARVAARPRARRRSTRCARACRACTRSSTCSSTRAISPRTRSTRSAASSATRRSASPRCSPSIRWARCRRRSRCSRSCTCTPRASRRASTATGGLLLLEEQDRALWDREQMRVGAEWLARRPAATCSRAITPRPASPPSTASRRRSRRRAGRRSPISTRCWSASRRRRCTR